MRNKKLRKIIVYSMLIAMILSTLLTGLAWIF